MKNTTSPIFQHMDITAGSDVLQMRKKFASLARNCDKVKSSLLSENWRDTMGLTLTKLKGTKKKKKRKGINLQFVAECTVKAAAAARIMLGINLVPTSTPIEVEWLDGETCV